MRVLSARAAVRDGEVRLGLRTKTIALLLAVAAVCILAAGVIGHQILTDIRRDLGASLARDSVRKTEQRTESKFGQDLAIVRLMSRDRTIVDWLADENDPVKRDRFIGEAELYRKALAGRLYTVAPSKSLHYYFADEGRAPVPTLGTTLLRDNPDDGWYFKTIDQPDGEWLNVDYDAHIGATKVWINVVARDGANAVVGVVSSGFDLTRFLDEVLASREAGVTTMIVDDNGAIIAHPDPKLIAYGVGERAGGQKTFYRLLDDDKAQSQARALLTQARNDPAAVPTMSLPIGGAPHIVAAVAIPALHWTVISTVEVGAGGAVTSARLLTIVTTALVLLGLVLIAANLGFDRMVLKPLSALNASVRRIAGGEYAVRLQSRRADELGELTRSFDDMAQRVRAHSEHLENLVAERTGELAQANTRITQAHAKLTDSIGYASLIQRAILPDRALNAHLPGRHFALWRPRDVVGGDLYLFYERDGDMLLGVADCAGHGVPGACMTMIAHAAMEVALGEADWSDPAAVITRVDAVMRRMLPAGERRAALATSMDLGLAYACAATGRLIFAGARLGLFWSDGDECRQVVGSRRGVNDRKPGVYQNVVLDMKPGRTFYMVSDGVFDLGGGEHGFGFGAGRFAEWVAANAGRPLSEQQASLNATLDAYRGAVPPRDDITVLAFQTGGHVQ